jgi:hypothetical protein
MLIDAQHSGTGGALSLGHLTRQEIVKPAFYGGPTDAFPPAQTAAVDAIVMRHKHAATERLGGPFAR